jgi:phosphate-selective porin OprO/OprP
MRMILGCHTSSLQVFAFVATMTLAATPLMGQSSPTPPLPVVTPTPTPQPSAAPTLPEDTPTPADNESAGTQPAGASDDEVPKKDQVTNPGDLAFTDYAAFDLDAIEPEPIRSKWGTFVAAMRGLTRYSLFDGKVKFRLGGSFMVDGTAGSGDTAFDEAYGTIDSDLGFRYGVLFAVGRVRDFNVSVGLDFGADPGIDSAWIEGATGGLEVWGHYLGKLRIGYVGEPFSLERQGSFYDTTFLERSLPVHVMAPGYNIGTMVHDSRRDGRLSWAAGLYSIGQTNEKNASNSRLSLTGRITYLPVYRDEGRRLIHVGLSVSSRSPQGSDVRYRGRPEARFVDVLVDTGSFSASSQTLWGVEAATVNGPMWAAAEIIGSDNKAQSVGDPNFWGGYVQVGWFITGESRPYQTNGGTFGRVLPLTKYRGGNPFKKRNGGAWEVAGRISHLDLDDGLIEGGKLTDFSAALNWYLNATVRVKLNYIHARPKDRGSANIFLLRVQYNPW